MILRKLRAPDGKKELNRFITIKNSIILRLKTRILNPEGDSKKCLKNSI